MRIDRWHDAVAGVPHFGRVMIGDAEFAFGRIKRRMRRRMYRHARMPNEEREEDGQANAV